MCGITGIHHYGGANAHADIVRRMTQSLSHRGPDDCGLHVTGSIGLGHTRLSIIDLSAAGRQPMHSEDGRCTLSYNGEVYNFSELRNTLEAKGHRFRGKSDTEVVLRSYIEWGTDCFRRFEGMFALALWDEAQQRLLLARDCFGIKPLYYYDSGAAIFFGSEIKALLASKAVTPRINWAGVHEYLCFGAALGANTTYDGFHKLLPGHLLSADADGVKITQYASMFEATPVADDLASAETKVRTLLGRAVKDHLASDVPVGVFLSAGIDSSAITAFASQQYPGQLTTYTAGFDFDWEASELAGARQVAERFGTDHHELHIGGEKVAPLIERLVRCHDGPFGNPANIPLYLLCEAVGGRHKVILTGEGGDELFGGYRTYWLAALQRLTPSLLRAGRRLGHVERLVPRRWGMAKPLRHLRILTRLGMDPSQDMALLRSVDSPVAAPFAGPAQAMLQASDPFQRYREHFHRFANLDPAQRMMRTDCGIRLTDLYFEKADRASMAHGIEVRVPLVDRQLAAYAMGLPAAYKVRGRTGKLILRRSLRGLVPDAVLDRPKTGFSVPLHHWLRTSLVDYLRSVLFDEATLRTGLFDRVAMERMVHEHERGQRNHGQLLHHLLNLALWLNAYRVVA